MTTQEAPGARSAAVVDDGVASAIRPIFVLSAPRSGSTLVQRMLAAHPTVATAAEPWLLLPLLGGPRTDLPDVASWHRNAAVGIREFAKDYLPAGMADYDRAMRRAALDLYARVAGPGATHFVDKTPGYTIIADDLARVFPDAAIVFLWRNPLGILASIIDTFDAGAFRPYHQALPLFDGPARMVDTQLRLGDRVTPVRFEDAIARDPETLRRLSTATGLQYTPETVNGFSQVHIPGYYGDPTGVHRYQRLSTEPTEKWRQVLGNPVRRAWARQYLRWLGRERLQVMGYDLDDLLTQADELPSSPTEIGQTAAKDAVGLAASMLRDTVKARAAFSSTSTWRRLL